MERIEREQYKKKIKLYENLGALDFQKVVFAVERLKFKILKKVSPNFITHYDKYCDKLRKKLIKDAKTEEDIRSVNSYINHIKLEMRREFNNEQNKNYHINSNDSTEIIKYLNYNKEVHQSSLVKDLILIPITTVGTIFITPWLTPLLAYEILSAFIDFECINIQNYNICRYKLIEDKLKQREERKIKETIEEYGDVAEIVTEKIETSEKLPSMNEIIDGLETKEQLDKLRKLITKELERKNTDKSKLYVRGNE
jgi:hypothetical protein